MHRLPAVARLRRRSRPGPRTRRTGWSRASPFSKMHVAPAVLHERRCDPGAARAARGAMRRRGRFCRAPVGRTDRVCACGRQRTLPAPDRPCRVRPAGSIPAQIGAAGSSGCRARRWEGRVRRGSPAVRRGARHRGRVLGRDATCGSESEACRRRCSAASSGYVGGGIFGRLLDRALGVVERRVDDHPARAVRRRHARRDRRRIAAVLCSCCRHRCCSRPGSRSRSRVSLVVDHGLARLPHPRAQERRGARDARAVDAPARARAGVRRARRSARRLVGGDGRPAAPARARRRARRRSAGAALRARRGAGVRRLARRDAPPARATRASRRSRRSRDEGSLRVFVLDDEVPDYDEVDAKLVALARRLQLRLLTNDGPLARNAEMQGVPTCNLRRLAQELSPVVDARRLRARRAHARRQGDRARASAISTTVRWSS